MPLKIRKEIYLSNCQVAEINPAECPVITTEDKSSNVPSQKRKEKVRRVIYLKK